MNGEISITRQAQLLGMPRSTYYYKPAGLSDFNLKMMRLIDEQYMKTPFYGSRRMTAWLRRQGYMVNRKRIRRLMEIMGIEAIYPKRNLSKPGKDNKIYPYLLGGKEITEVNQVWSADITYIRLRSGFLYLVAIMDWYSRYILSWEVSITLEAGFCVKALERALEIGKPEIFNTDQGVQFTSARFIEVLEEDNEIKISMDGKGRALDNIFIERIWRTLKYEEVYLKNYENVLDAVKNLNDYFNFYNNERLHQSLDYRTPAEVYGAGIGNKNECYEKRA